MEDKKQIDPLPIVLGLFGLLQIITIIAVSGIPTDKVEMVCRGLYESPDVIRCYQQ